MTALVGQTLLPDAQEAGTGGEHELEALLAVLTASDTLSLHAGDRTAEVPDPLRQVLHTALTNLLAGTAVTIATQRTQLTTQEAADLLGISRPTVVRLLDTGEIPSTRPGRHRRVELADVLEYQRRLRDQRAHALAELAEPEDIDSDAGGFISTR